MLRQTSLATLGLSVGSILTIIGLIAYATDNPTLNLAGFFYGIPLVLGGLALKTAELKPIPLSQPTSPEILALREQQATVTQNQIRKDVTRYRYGQDVHLDYALARLGLGPVLTTLEESETDGAYTLTLQFESPLISLEAWQQKQEKIEAYFGPGVRVRLTQPTEERIDLALIAIPQE
jgi:hypothetical protein